LARRPKRHSERRQRMALALRTWHVRARSRRFGALLPLLRSLAPVMTRCLRHAFTKLRQPVMMNRRSLATVKVLQIIRGQTQLRMATCHRRQALIRKALAALRAEWFHCRGMSRLATFGGGYRTRNEPGEPFVLEPSSPSQLQQERLRILPRHESRASPAQASKEVSSSPSPQSLLLQVQQEGFRCWWRAVSMDVSREELLEQRRKASILALVRMRSQNAIALNHRVASLLGKAMASLQLHCFGEGLLNRASLPAQGPRPPAYTFRGRRHGSKRKGLRGMSVAEVARKAWQRWRFAVASGAKILLPEPWRPANVTLALCNVAAEIEAICQEAKPKRRQHGIPRGRQLPAPPDMPVDSIRASRTPQLEASESSQEQTVTNIFQQQRMQRQQHEQQQQQLLQSTVTSKQSLGPEVTWQPPPPSDPPHLAILRKALASFDRLAPPPDVPVICAASSKAKEESALPPALLWRSKTLPPAPDLLHEVVEQQSERWPEQAVWFPPRPHLGVGLSQAQEDAGSGACEGVVAAAEAVLAEDAMSKVRYSLERELGPSQEDYQSMRRRVTAAKACKR